MSEVKFVKAASPWTADPFTGCKNSHCINAAGKWVGENFVSRDRKWCTKRNDLEKCSTENMVIWLPGSGGRGQPTPKLRAGTHRPPSAKRCTKWTQWCDLPSPRYLKYRFDCSVNIAKLIQSSKLHWSSVTLLCVLTMLKQTSMPTKTQTRCFDLFGWSHWQDTLLIKPRSEENEGSSTKP